MQNDNRRVFSWTHIEGNQNYRNSMEKYNHKIYSMGVHEFGVTKEGKIYNYNSNRATNPTNGNYFNADGSYTGVKFPVAIEDDMVKYRSIKWYLQMIIFGWGTVKPILDNNTYNSEGRLPQDQFIHELKKIIDIYDTHRNTGEPLLLEGIEMDVEASMTADTVSSGNDVNYIRFLERIKNEVIIPRKMKMRVNAHAMWGNNLPFYYRFHNYKLFAESTDMRGNATIDEIQLMTYDYAWSGSAPGASTPVWWFQEVGEWCLDCFDPERNPKAKLTIDNLYFGAAGYGNRWGMHDQEAVKRGSNITYHQLLGWQNGHFRHYHTEPDGNSTKYVYHDQDYIFQAATQDEESKYEVMYPYVYDMFVPKYTTVRKINGGSSTATIGTYNRLDYAASNFKQQIPKFTGVKAVITKPSSFSGKAYPMAVLPEVKKKAADAGIDVNQLPDEDRQKWDTNLDPESVDFQHTVKTVGDEDHVFVGWYTSKRTWIPKNEYEMKKNDKGEWVNTGNIIGATCELENKQDGTITYNVSVPSGTYRVVAITSFSWYTQAKLGGTINGQSFVIGGENIPEHYPFFMKGAHFYDVGSYSFNGGGTITISGANSDSGTPIYGFVICEDFEQNFSGGELTMEANVQPMKKKDGSLSKVPSRLSLAMKMLRRDARPAILWDDEFRTYGEETIISGKGENGRNIGTTYYHTTLQGSGQQGAGDNPVIVGETEGDPPQPIYQCFSDPMNLGYSQGLWVQKDYAVEFNSADNPEPSGQLVLSKQWHKNHVVEARLMLKSGQRMGVRFLAQSQGNVADGYLFVVDMKEKKRYLIYETYTGEDTYTQEVIAEQGLGNMVENQYFLFQVLIHEGKAYCSIGGVLAFKAASGNPVQNPKGEVNTSTGAITLRRTYGAAGVYAVSANVRCSRLGIGSLDRWETLEKFEMTVDGVTKEYGRLKRTGYSYDEFGYLIYSGTNERSTRDNVEGVDWKRLYDNNGKEIGIEEFNEQSGMSLDYEVTVEQIAGFEGAKEIKIRLVDAGVWFGELLVGDAEGMSIIWTGDAYSFNAALNMAVTDYKAKGIGLWALGQEDPSLWEMIPDVVPKGYND